MAQARNKTQQQLDAAQKYLVETLDLLKRQFYADVTDKVYYRDRKQLTHAVTWPATWLGGKGLCIPADRYRKLIADRLLEIKQHGDWEKHQKHFPRYLLKCIQQHFIHHGEALYEEFKAVSFSVERVLNQLPEASEEQSPVDVLAHCHQITKPQPRRPKPTPVDDGQQSLF